MNPPYGGVTTAAELTNFPAQFKTSETAVLFIAYITKRLKQNGRAGVIIPDGFLFGNDGASVEVKRVLLEEMNLHTIIRLPSSVLLHIQVLLQTSSSLITKSRLKTFGFTAWICRKI